jgi:hypothetical protein
MGIINAQKLYDMKNEFTVEKKLGKVLDNCEPFKLKGRTDYATWTVIEKKGRTVQINSNLGKNAYKKSSLIVYVTS